jgi:zinc protease
MKSSIRVLVAIACLVGMTQWCWGISTVQLPVATDPTVSFRILFNVGSQDDPAGKEGLAELTASMVTDAATKQNSYDQILAKLYPMAAGYSSSVDKEMTVISGRVHKDNLNDYVTLLTQAITQPAFNDADFQRLKTNALNYLDRTLRYSNDEAFAKEIMYDAIYAGTPYGHPTTGLPASVQGITLDDVKNFYGTHYTAANVVIGVGGSVDPALVDRLNKELSTLPAQAPPAAAAVTPKPLSGISAVIVAKETPSTAISFGFPIDVKRGDPDFYRLWVANSWLGEHRNGSSHLYQVIRETRGMNYGDYSYLEYFPNPWWHSFPPPNSARHQQLFEIWIRPVPNEQAQFALRAAMRELQKLIDSGMTADDFALTRSFLSKYVRHYAPTTDWRLGYKLDDAFYGVSDHLQMAEKSLENMTVDQVNQALKKHLQTSNLTIGIVTKDAQALKAALVSGAPSPITYATPKGPEVLEEDKTIATYPIKISADKVTIVPADSTFMR